MLRIRDSNRTELIDVMQRDLSRLPIIKILILLPERGLATAGTCLFRRHRSQGLGTYFALARMSYEEQSCNDWIMRATCLQRSARRMSARRRFAAKRCVSPGLCSACITLTWQTVRVQVLARRQMFYCIAVLLARTASCVHSADVIQVPIQICFRTCTSDCMQLHWQQGPYSVFLQGQHFVALLCILPPSVVHLNTCKLLC